MNMALIISELTEQERLFDIAESVMLLCIQQNRRKQMPGEEETAPQPPTTHVVHIVLTHTGNKSFHTSERAAKAHARDLLSVWMKENPFAELAGVWPRKRLGRQWVELFVIRGAMARRIWAKRKQMLEQGGS